MQPIMFHYFYDNVKYKKVDGALSAAQLEQIIVNEDYPVLSADKWLEKFEAGTLANNETCLTFDDGIREQLEIALPVMEKHGIKAIFNFCTFAFTGDKDTFEIYRYFRNNYFDTIDEFYNAYFSLLEQHPDYHDAYQSAQDTVNFSSYLAHATFYTFNDRKFRYCRDVLFKFEHEKIMNSLIEHYQVDVAEITSKLWITPDELRGMAKQGQLIGIHSHEHSTVIDSWTQEQQLISYSKNKELLEDIIGEVITLCAYPCGKNNQHTPAVLDALNINYAFIASCITSLDNNEPYLIPRIDSTDFAKKLGIY